MDKSKRWFSWLELYCTETGKEDVTHLVGDNKNFYDSRLTSVVSETYRAGYQAYRKLVPVLEDKINNMKRLVDELQQVKIAEKENEKIAGLINERLSQYKNKADLIHSEIDGVIERASFHLEHGLNITNNEEDTAKGNNDVSPDALGLVFNPNLYSFSWHSRSRYNCRRPNQRKRHTGHC